VNPYYGAAVKYCGKYINESGFNILFAFSNDDQSNENDIVNQFISQRVAGILIAPTNQGNMKTNYIDNLKRSEIPFLYFTSYYNDVDAPYSMINLESGSYQLIRYLLDLGHKEIFFLSSDKEMVSTKTRINGYIRAFKERGLVVDEDYFVNCKHVTFEQSVLSTESLLKSNRKIDAIVTMNDVMALGSLRVLLDNGIEIPDQISLAGYDDVLFSNISAIPITTVKQDLKRLCNISVDMLVNMINNGVRPENVMLQPELIVRRSTGRKK
jgi:LacI family transcriptional regulator